MLKKDISGVNVPGQDTRIENAAPVAASEQPSSEVKALTHQLDEELINEVSNLISKYTDVADGQFDGRTHLCRFVSKDNNDLREINTTLVSSGVKKITTFNGYKNVSLNAVVKITAITDNKYEPLF